MRIQTKVCLFFAAMVPVGFFLGMVLCLRFGVRFTFGLLPEGEGGFPFGTLLRYYYLIRVPLLIFCAGFTVFAPFVSSVSLLYLGTLLGGLICSGEAAKDGMPTLLPFLLLALLLTLLILLGAQAAQHRSTLRSAAPRAETFAHSPETRAYVTCFMTTAAVFLCAALLDTFFPGLILLF